ncbi:acetyltransferase [Vibrio quintilis]|uniref:Putative acetyltransferase EpsM n=1 Tax=Vibrio quintilis TaxID=1117707 RepID=A0A1M7YY49_9VIBR|nr:acetyltransferase [Vibrio quintilis]SHO57609.1 Putative acetyltransferase EpsM [Vibrio quintilis]
MSNAGQLPLVLIGGGGHASVLADILLRQQRNILAVISPDDISGRAVFRGITHYQQDDDVLQFQPDQVRLVNGIGMIPGSDIKKLLNQYYLSLGYRFETVIASEAVISPYATISDGAQIFPGAIIQAGTVIGQHSVINTGVIIEHDCCIGDYNHIAPGSTVCGQVETETDVFVGAGATIIQNLKLKHQAVVGAGAVLTKSLAGTEIAYPARAVIKSIQ